ncbi:MAG TPA: hypothetical protein VK878_08565 [Candidatus Deferrimicrobiaceae bacterium]|nr:hypothetical protein [Candidatus Deferrimicrobiaceae bacterium]
MKIAFLASRKGYLKVMGSLIQASIERGHEVVLVHDPGERKPGETVTAEDLQHWPRARIVTHRRGEPLVPLLPREGAQALVGPSLHFVLSGMGLEPEMKTLRAAGVRLYSVDYVLDALNSEPEAYRVVDRTFYTSEHQRRLHWTILAERFDRVRQDVDLTARSAVSGSTMLDQLDLVDRAAVRRRLGIAPGRPVVLLMSLKMAVPEPWRRYVWGGGPALVRAAAAAVRGQGHLVPEIWRGNGYRALARAVRRFCGRTGAVFVVKSREKNRDPRFLRRLADVFVERDDDVFPYTSIQLMAVADFCIHFQSGAALEAAMAGVPSASVVVPQSHLHEYPGYQQIFGTSEGSLQNFPGIVWSVPHDRAAALLDERTLADFKPDPSARRAYVERYLGFDDLGSSRRVLDVIEEDVEVRPRSAPGAAPPA